jgi:hypothetical protein
MILKRARALVCRLVLPAGMVLAIAAPAADLTLTRTFALARKERVEFRADVFNLFNNENDSADGRW